jgi:hypothetical protein
MARPHKRTTHRRNVNRKRWRAWQRAVVVLRGIAQHLLKKRRTIFVIAFLVLPLLVVAWITKTDRAEAPTEDDTAAANGFSILAGGGFDADDFEQFQKPKLSFLIGNSWWGELVTGAVLKNSQARGQILFVLPRGVDIKKATSAAYDVQFNGPNVVNQPNSFTPTIEERGFIQDHPLGTVVALPVNPRPGARKNWLVEYHIWFDWTPPTRKLGIGRYETVLVYGSAQRNLYSHDALHYPSLEELLAGEVSFGSLGFKANPEFLGIELTLERSSLQFLALSPDPDVTGYLSRGWKRGEANDRTTTASVSWEDTGLRRYVDVVNALAFLSAGAALGYFFSR